MKAPCLKAVIEPGTITVLRHAPSYGRDDWLLGPSALEYTDRALLHYCGVTPEFGGVVERALDRVSVSVYTD
jgi:hypothetical protein